MMLAWLAMAALAAAPPQEARTPGGRAPTPVAPDTRLAPAPWRVAQGEASTELPDTLMEDIQTASFPLNGWTYLTDGVGGIVFYRSPIQRRGGAPRVSTRWEFNAVQSGAGGRYLSLEQVQDIDCIQGRSQVVQRLPHRAHNLAGPVVGESTTSEAWVAPEPGSLDEAVLRKACAPL